MHSSHNIRKVGQKNPPGDSFPTLVGASGYRNVTCAPKPREHKLVWASNQVHSYHVKLTTLN